MRLLGVVAADAQTTVNTRAKEADIDSRGGEFLATVPLARNGNVVAYWWSWGPLSTQRAKDIRDRFAEQFESGKVVWVPRSEKGSFRRDNSVKVYAFDAAEPPYTDDGWTPDEVLAALGLQRVEDQ